MYVPKIDVDCHLPSINLNLSMAVLSHPPQLEIFNHGHLGPN